MDRDQVARTMAAQTTEELLTVIGSAEGEYEPDAVALAREELERRKVPLETASAAASPEAARCPMHPQSLALGTCARCGRFICIACRDASPGEHRCVECAALVASRPPRLGGWLIVAAIVLFAYPLSFLSSLVAFWVELRRVGWPLPSGNGTWFALTLWDLVSVLGMAALSVAIWPRYFGKRVSAPKWMQGFFFANITLQVVNAVLGALNGNKVVVMGLLGPLVIATLWISYFQKAERVRRTFVVPDRS